MYPNLFRIGSFTITSFGVMMFLSFLAAAWTLSIQVRRRGFDPEFAWDVLAWVALGGILGAKLYYLALHWNDLVRDPGAELANFRAGLVWYGGFIGGALAFLWQIRRRGYPVAQMFDAVAAPVTLAYAIGRVGCFLVGDDYGVHTNSWVGIAFPQGAPPSTAGYLRSAGDHIPANIPDNVVLPVHPTQLYEIGAALVIFAILWRVSSRRLAPGRLFGLYLMLYGLERFLVEFVRAKTDRFILGLSTSQLVSLGLIAFGAWLWQRRRAAAERHTAQTGAPDRPGRVRSAPAN